ncbi:hypothetical protein QJS66_20245 [Kocuria rhizophila]|nr:hypothetical protein QJS66_20245 [Kocuria rhizophila]
MTGLLLSEAVIAESPRAQDGLPLGVNQDEHRTYNVVDVQLSPCSGPGPAARGARCSRAPRAGCAARRPWTPWRSRAPAGGPAPPPRERGAARLRSPTSCAGARRIFDAAGGVPRRGPLPVGRADRWWSGRTWGAGDAVDGRRLGRAASAAWTRWCCRSPPGVLRARGQGGDGQDPPLLSAVSTPLGARRQLGAGARCHRGGVGPPGRCNVYSFRSASRDGSPRDRP